MPVPTRRLAVVAAIAAVLVLLAPVQPGWTLLIVELALLGAAAADVILAPAPARILVERGASIEGITASLDDPKPPSAEVAALFHTYTSTSRR